ncbi:DUF4465 domain-containing protein [Thalassoroseus pseudoceratinae]|uniref:DUF4465 domain-containing protein n=1 Tax=Thalassoroseus pseudoceratinae TaxID=2713176 RepID=UPI00141E3DE6|nr:DUF4465 domain-containing protein [Thalassoroseus pseudoceratinae]
MTLTHWLKNLLPGRVPNRMARRRASLQQVAVACVETLEERTLLTAVVDFEDIPLDAESHFNGPDPNGTIEQGSFGDVQVGKIESGGVEFSNVYDLTFGSWSGFAVSNETDTTTPGFGNQFSAFPGTGVGAGADNYGLGFGHIGGLDSTDEDQLRDLPTITLPDGYRIETAQFTNTTYTALSMRDGDLFTKQFGGPTGDDPDFFKLSVYGIDASGEALGTEVEFYLADFRFSDNSQDYILDTWEALDLSSLADARTLHFNLTSSDVGDFGMNTPAYFAIDSLVFQTPPDPNAIVDAGDSANDGTADEFMVDVDGTDLVVTVNGNEVLRQPWAETESLTLNGSSDDDSFTIDQNDDLIEIPININGGLQTNADTLIVDGGTFDTVTIDHTSLADGSLQLDSAAIQFTGIEPLNVTGSTTTNLVINLTDVPDTTDLSVSDGSLTIESTNGSHGDDRLDLNGVTTISINAAAGADTLTFQDIAVDEYTGDWNVEGGTEIDSYVVMATATVALSNGFALEDDEEIRVDGELLLPSMAFLSLGDLSRLTGHGVVQGNVVAAGAGRVSPGENFGQLTIDGNLDLAGGELTIILGGQTAGTDYDQVVVTNSATEVDLTGTTLSSGLEFAPMTGDVFTILDNQSMEPITGTFNGLAEGAEFELQNPILGITSTVQISYIGGDGNDVTLTVLEPLVTPAETDVILADGALTITDVNGGDSDDSLTLSIADGILRVSDPYNTLAGSGTGVVEVDEHIIEIPVENITAGISINTQSGTDQVTFDSAFDLNDNLLSVETDILNLDGSLTTTGAVTLNANVELNQPLTITASALEFAGTVTGIGDTAVTLITDNLELGGSLVDIFPTLEPLTPGTSIGLGGAAGTLNLDDAELANLGALGAIIGDATKAGTITLDSAIFAGDVTLIGALILGNAGVDLTAGGEVQLQATVQPGGIESVGELSVDSLSLTFDAIVSTLVFDAVNAGNAGIDYDQLQILGIGQQVNWNNVPLTVQFDPNYMPTDGDEFTLVNFVDAGAGSVGVLGGLVEGDSISFDGFEATISYIGGDGNDVTLTIQTLNRPPEITAPIEQTTDEDTPLIFRSISNNRISISDPDAADADVEITLAVTNGTLTLGQMSGSTLTVTDTIDNLNSLLNGLVYQPHEDFFGSDTLTMSVDDLGNTGNGGPQIGTASINLNINPVNESPINTVPSPQSVAYLTELVFSSTTENRISIADPDITTGAETVEVTLSVTSGIISLATTSGLQFIDGDGADDSTITVQGALSDINNALDGLTYRSNIEFFGEDVLTITTNDLGQIGTEPLDDTDTMSITVAEPIIDSPLSQLEETPISPSLINGDFTNVVSGNFDGDGAAENLQDDLFYWNPTTGANRLVRGDGTIQNSVIDPLWINGDDFFEMIAADLDADAPDDLFFWNPVSGKNRLAHISFDEQVSASVEADAVDRTLINGNDYTTLVAGDLDGEGPADLFLWHPATGANRLIHLSEADVAAVENDVIPRQMINGNDYEQIRLGDFVAGGLAELAFVNLSTGANRLIELTAVTPGQDTAFDQLTTSWIQPTTINGGVYSQIVVGDFDNNGLSDVFAWNPVSGENRLLLAGITIEVIDQPITPSMINGGVFDTATPLMSQTDLGSGRTDLLFWDSVTGQNRMLIGEITTSVPD